MRHLTTDLCHGIKSVSLHHNSHWGILRQDCNVRINESRSRNNYHVGAWQRPQTGLCCNILHKNMIIMAIMVLMMRMSKMSVHGAPCCPCQTNCNFLPGTGWLPLCRDELHTVIYCNRLPLWALYTLCRDEAKPSKLHYSRPHTLQSMWYIYVMMFKMSHTKNYRPPILHLHKILV